MHPLRISTFNCENLYVYHRLRDKDIRFDNKNEIEDIGFDASGVPITSLEGGWRVGLAQRHATARCIISRQPDIIALQEVENLDVLNRFLSRFVNNKKILDLRKIYGSDKKRIKWRFDYRIVIDGNDDHKIDVALLSRYPIRDIRTHFWEKIPGTNTDYFPRDCLEADIELPNGKVVTFLVNHFTSRGSDRTGKKRERQAIRLIEILKERFGPNLDQGNFVVCGDLNDEPTNDALRTTLYDPSLDLMNPISNLPQEQQWTHFWYYDSGTPRPKPFAQLDHILLSPSFREGNEDPHVEIDRRGLLRTFKQKVSGDFPIEKAFRKVSEIPGTEGSDHCSVFVDLETTNLV